MLRKAFPHWFLWFALLATHAVTHADPAFDPQRVRWSMLDYTASKLLLSARAQVEMRVLPREAITRQLLATPEGTPVSPGPAVIEMVYRASGLGRESVTTLWADPMSGATLQQVQQDAGGRLRQRTYRFTDIGAYHYTRRPAGRREESLPPEQWTDLSQGMRAYAAGSNGRPVTAATMLLWLASAADLSRRGDRLEVLVFSRRHLNRISIEVAGRRSVAVDFIERAPGARRQRRGKLDAMVLQVRGQLVDAPPDADEEFELLGLSGNIELLLDPANRIPLQLTGRAKILGQVTIRLREAVLR